MCLNGVVWLEKGLFQYQGQCYKASNGWLQSFKIRHHIKQLAINGESGNVNEETVKAIF